MPKPSQAPTSNGLRPRKLRDLVLVGGGHSHVQVLRGLAMEPPPDTRLTVVLDTPIAVYSGMVPGFVAGQYEAAELEIDVLPLARRAQARVILAAATGLDPEARRLSLAGRPSIPYDVISFDVGSTVAHLDRPGVREHSFPTRPIGRFVARFQELMDKAKQHEGPGPFSVVVVGAGAGGVELAFALKHRLGEVSSQTEVTLLQGGKEILPGASPALRQRTLDAARAAGIVVRTGAPVDRVTAQSVRLDGGEELAATAVLWVTGAASHDLFRSTGLTTDERGFLQVRPTLQSLEHDEIFASGDCAQLRDFPWVPKAGVYAVRAGPFLTHNLGAILNGRRLREYRPQQDFLALLNLGDGNALGGKWGRAFGGPWVIRWKDWIDRRFMRRFQVLDAVGALTEEFAAGPSMGEMNMLCGGCAAKVGQKPLDRALRRLGQATPATQGATQVVMGLEQPDDAAVVRLPGGELLAATVDMFRAFSDDPYLVGQVAAVNACSDLLAKGVRPAHALALVAVPEEAEEQEAEEQLFQVLSGARAALDELGTTLLGGHTTTAQALMVGFSITGTIATAEDLLPITAARPGQSLVLSKALGTGVLFHADMQGRLRGPWLQAALGTIVRSNLRAMEIALAAGTSAATDITGFGLAGHLGEMMRASGCSAAIRLSALPGLPGARELLAQGMRSTFHPENAKARRAMVLAEGLGEPSDLDLIFDPQTSGGLLFAVDTDRAEDTVTRLHAAGDRQAAVIGRCQERHPDGALILVEA